MPREARDKPMDTPKTGARKEAQPPTPEREKAAGMDVGL